MPNLYIDFPLLQIYETQLDLEDLFLWLDEHGVKEALLKVRMADWMLKNEFLLPNASISQLVNICGIQSGGGGDNGSINKRGRKKVSLLPNQAMVDGSNGKLDEDEEKDEEIVEDAYDKYRRLMSRSDGDSDSDADILDGMEDEDEDLLVETPSRDMMIKSNVLKLESLLIPTPDTYDDHPIAIVIEVTLTGNFSLGLGVKTIEACHLGLGIAVGEEQMTIIVSGFRYDNQGYSAGKSAGVLCGDALITVGGYAVGNVADIQKAMSFLGSDRKGVANSEEGGIERKVRMLY